MDFKQKLMDARDYRNNYWPIEDFLKIMNQAV